MPDHLVLIISHHQLLAAAIQHVIEREGIGPVVHVHQIQEALEVIGEQHPAAIIVEVENGTPCEETAAQLLTHHDNDCQVVCVSLSNSDITVFTRHRIPHATQTELVRILHNSITTALESLSAS